MCDMPGGGRGSGLLGLGGQYVCLGVFSKLSKVERLEAVAELIRGLDVDESIAFVNLMDGQLKNSIIESENFQEDTEDEKKLREVIECKDSKDIFREMTENEGQNSTKLASFNDINYTEDLRDDGKYVCRWEGCGKILESKDQYRWHEYADHKAGNENKKESYLTSHIALHSQEDFFSWSSKTVKRCEKGHCFKYNCHLCSYSTLRRTNFESHVNNHLNIKPYKCLICEFKTANKLSLTHHMKTMHALDTFKHSCHLCDFKTQRKENLNHHVNVHLNIRPFSCPFCEVRTFEKRDLKRHVLRRHVTGETSLSQLEQTYPLLYKPSRPLDSWRNDSLP